jgi:rare lipoprotein A
MTHAFKKTAILALTTVLSVAALGTTASAADYNGHRIAPQASAQYMFDQNRVDPVLYPHQSVGAPYTVKGQTYVPAHNPKYDMVGSVSWYGQKFQGKMTASGERFNKNAMTAAHKTLPINSLVVVTNMATGQAVTVRINDRGPFVGNGVIDLSAAAAGALGYTAARAGNVRVQYAGAAMPVQQTAPVRTAQAQPRSVMPRVALPRTQIAVPEAYAQQDVSGDQTETLTVKGPIHMASQKDTGNKARFIRAVYRTTSPSN